MNMKIFLFLGLSIACASASADPNRDLVLSARDGNLAGVQKALDLGAQIDRPGDLEDYKGVKAFKKTALHWAAAMGHLPVVEYLVHRGAKLDGRDLYGYTPLGAAAAQGHLPVARFLMSKGSDPHIRLFGSNLLFYSLDHPAMVSFLLTSKFDLTEKSEFCTTILMQAARQSAHPALEILLRAGADPNYQLLDCSNRSALHEAVEAKSIPCVRLLVQFGARPSVQDKDGVSPLDSARKMGLKEIVEILENPGASTAPNSM